MASVSPSGKSASERRFFFYMAFAIFFTVLAGFGSQPVTRRVWSPALSRLLGLLPRGSFTSLAVIGALLLFIAAGIAFDLATWRRVHPAC